MEVAEEKVINDTKPEQSSYQQIFKSSFLIGGSQVINILIGILKNKALAVLLGPAGIGVMGVYMAVSAIITSIAGLGIGSSGVRQISESISEGDKQKTAFLVRYIRRILLIAASAAVLFVIAASRQLAQLSFAAEFRPEYVAGVVVISGLILFDTLTTGEKAILQGTRNLKSLAIAQILGAFAGAIGSIAVVYFMAEQGIAWFLFIGSLLLFLVFRYYASKVDITGPTSSLSLKVISQQKKALVTLGLAFVITTVAGSIVAYILRVLIIKLQGVEGVGIYQAAWGLVNMGFNVVLLAMGTDFYPRLVAVAGNTKMVRKTVNEQVEVTLLFALPIVLVLYLLSPLILQIFFSSEFTVGAGLTRWLAISCFLRVLCWPLGYITIAKAKKSMFVITSIIWEIVHIPIILVCIKFWGLEGIGISYVIDYAIVLIGASLISYKYFDFTWSKETFRSVGISALLVAAVVIANYAGLSSIAFYATGFALTALAVARLVLIAQKKLNFSLLKYLGGRR